MCALFAATYPARTTALDHGRELRAPDVGARLPLGPHARAAPAVHGAVPARVGRARGARRALAERRQGRARPPVVGAAPPDGREPGGRRGAPPDECGDGHPARAAGHPRADAHPPQRRRPGARHRRQPLHGRADPRSQVRRAARASITSPGGTTRTRSSTRSRSSSRASGTAPSPTASWRPCSSPTSSAPRRGPPPSGIAAGATSSRGTTTLVRRELGRFRGREIDTAGDGFLATFDGPARGVRCARAVSDGVRALGLEVRAGLHTGEVELLDDKVSGPRRPHRRPRRRRGRARRGARVQHRQGPGRRLRPPLPGPRPPDPQGRPGRVAPLRARGGRPARVKRLCVFCGSSDGRRTAYADAARAHGHGAGRPGHRPRLRRRVGRADGDARGRGARRGRRGDRRPAAGPRPQGATPTPGSPSSTWWARCTSARRSWPRWRTASWRCRAASARSRRSSRSSPGPSSASTGSPWAWSTSSGYWAGLLALLRHAVGEGFVRARVRGAPPGRARPRRAPGPLRGVAAAGHAARLARRHRDLTAREPAFRDRPRGRARCWSSCARSGASARWRSRWATRASRPSGTRRSARAGPPSSSGAGRRGGASR